MNKRHFHTLDAIRFILFLKVFICHLPLASYPIIHHLRQGGDGTAVDIFFVISGFFITYFILFEKEKTGKLNLKNFFIRRILRTWPLFYLMLVVAFLTPAIMDVFRLKASSAGYEPEWWKSFLFLENYQMMFKHDGPNVAPLSVMWSLCVEEHYYLLWGTVLYFAKINHMPVVIIASILIANATRFFYSHVGLAHLDVFSNLDFFAYGAIPAYLLIVKENTLLMRVSEISLSAKIVTVLIFILFMTVIPFVDVWAQFYLVPVVLGVLSGILITFLLPEQNRFKIEDSHFLSKLGLYTYGLYIFHTVVINGLLLIYKRIGVSLTIGLNAGVFFVLALSLCIVAAGLSYHLFEMGFLRLKKYFY